MIQEKTMSTKKRPVTARFLLVIVAAIVLTASGAFALARGGSPGGFLSGLAEALSLNITAKAESAREDADQKDEKAATPAGGGIDGLIYGMGDLPLTFPDRRDKIFFHDPVNGPVSLGSVNDFEPAWSPDGKKIAFVSLRDGDTRTYDDRRRNRELYIMNADGTDQQRLGSGQYFGAESQPSFSPDGRYIVYSADYSYSGHGYGGLYIFDTFQNETTQVFPDMGSACYDEGEDVRGNRPKNKRQTENLVPGEFGPETPIFTPDGQYIIFGENENYDYVRRLKRIKLDGSECTTIFELDWWYDQYQPLFAQFSPDGTKIALTYGYDMSANAQVSAGDQPTHFIAIITPNGNLINELPLSKKARHLSWSPDGTKIAYITSTNYPNVPNGEIWTVDANFGHEEQVVFHGGYETFRGLSWGTPSSEVPPLRVKINDPHPVEAGTSTTGTVYLSSPAPAGGTTVTLSYNGDLTQPYIFTFPESTDSPRELTLTVPEGATEAAFQIDVPMRSQYRSADVAAVRSSPFGLARATVTVMPPKADLTVTTFTAPATVAPGAFFNVNSVVSNIGGASTNVGFIDRIFFSTDDVLDGTDGSFVGSRSQSALAAGAQTPLNSISVNIPVDRIPSNGTYYLIYETNSNRAADENLRYSNNRYAVPIQIELPDIVSEDLSVPDEILPATNYNVTWNVRNAGAAGTSNNFINSLYVSFDEVIGNGDDILLSSQLATGLEVGAVASYSATINIPTVPARASGSVTIYAVADRNNTVFEGQPDGPGENNNTVSAISQFNYRVADLEVVSTSLPVEVDSDTPFAVAWTTANVGNRDAGSFQESVYFSVDNQVNANDVLLGTFPLPSGLTAGASVERIQNVTIPTNQVPLTPPIGSYWIYVRTDANSNINEGENENNNIRWHPVQVRRLLRPDLTVTNITAPDNAFFDQTIQVQWTVSNSGQGPTNAANWKDRISMFPSAQSSGGSVAEVDNISFLNAGESYIASAAVKVPRGYVGSYKIGVKTDQYGALNEENTTNNALTRDIMLSAPPLPDLIVNNVQAPNVVYAGEPVSITWTVENIGDAAAAATTAAWRDRVYLSTDETFSPGTDRLIFTGEARSAPLGAGLTYTGQTQERVKVNGEYIWRNINLPSNVPAGEYYVFVLTDALNGVYEFAGENNNSAYDSQGIGFPMTVLSTPFDLVANTAPIAPDDVTGGQSVEVSFTIRNQGAFSTWGSWRDGLYLSADQTLSADDTLLGSVNHSGFGPGEQRTVELNVMVPQCLNGTYYLIAKADYANQAYEFDPGYDAEANNESPVKQIQITSIPADLVVTDVNIPAITGAGQTFDLSWTVHNNGSGPANEQWYDRIMLHSANGMGSTQLAFVRHTEPLAAGSSYTTSQTVTLPQYMQGQYHIEVRTDYNNNVAECGVAEDNNVGTSSSFSLDSNLPDLVIDSITPSVSTIEAGGSMQIEWTGRNQGAAMGANIPGWIDRVYLSSNTTVSNNDWLMGSSVTQIPLMPGQTYNKQVTVNLGNVPAGNYYILLVTDAANNVYEGPNNSLFETNNLTVSTPISVTVPGIDLQAVVNSVTAPTYSGQPVNIEWTVTNHGDAETLTNAWVDRIILSRDSVIDATDPVIGWRNRTGTLAGNASYTVNHTVLMPAGLTGTYRIFVRTDHSNQVVENNESNNLSGPLDIELELAPPADLNVTNITVPGSASPGDFIPLTWAYQNSGNFPAVGPWRDSVYLSLDPYWDAGDILLGQQPRTGDPLGIGAAGTASRSFQLPPMEDGEYYVIVRLDSQNRVRETNEANNVAVSTGRIVVGMTTLIMEEDHNTILNDGGFKSFRFEPGVDETVLVSLTGEAGKNNGLFTKYLTPVNLSNYEFQGDGQNTPDKENLVPVSEEGSYYSMVTNDFIPQNLRDSFSPVAPDTAGKGRKEQAGSPEAMQEITVRAERLPFVARQVNPSFAGNVGIASLVIEGAKFAPDVQVKLTRSGHADILPLEFVSNNTIIAAVFDLKGKNPGMYNVTVINPDEVSEIVDGFEIKQGGGYDVRLTANGPQNLSFGAQRARYTFSVSNDGLNDAIKVPLIIRLPVGMTYSLDRSNINEIDFGEDYEEYSEIEFPDHLDDEDYRSIMLLVPVLRSRQTVHVGVDIVAPTMGAFTVLADVFEPLSELTGSEPLSGNLTQASIAVSSLGPVSEMTAEECARELMRQLLIDILKTVLPFNCLGATLNAVANLIDLASWAMMNGNKSNVFESLVTVFGAIGNSVGKWAIHCATDGLKKSPAFLIGQSTMLIAKALWTVRKCRKKEKEVRVSRPAAKDPNEMIGPEGYGPERFISAQEPLFYRINFENVPEATAPAQWIYITDILPPELDPRTVRLKEIGFNHQTFVVPENRAFYTSRVDYDTGEQTIKADIFAGLDIVNRRVTWTLTAIDPNTGERPLDPLVGLLPPNNEDRDGEGYVTFTVEAYDTLPNRIPISNFATIIFDENEPIVTNIETNLLDSVVPSSQVAPMSATSDSPEIPVSWSGTDDVDGSGLAYCEIRVSENGGNFTTALRPEAIAGSEVFTGKWGTRYGFYSVCADNSGNIESAPLLPDAEILIRGGATESDVSPRPDGSDGVVNGDDVTQLRQFAVGLDTTFQYNEFQRADSAPLNAGGDGRISVIDVVQANRFAAGLDQKVSAIGPNEPFAGLRKAAGGGSLENLGGSRELRAYAVRRTGNRITVGVLMDADGDEAGVGFTLNFDPSVLGDPGNAAIGTGASGGTVTVNTNDAANGKVGIIVDKLPSQPFAEGSVQVVTIEFTVAVGAVGSTEIGFGDDVTAQEVSDVNALPVAATFMPSMVELAGPTAAEVSVSGRVLTSGGRAISNARVTFRNAAGGSRTVNSNGFGHYRIPGLMPGEAYVIEVKVKGHSFQTRTLLVDDEMAGVDLIASPSGDVR